MKILESQRHKILDQLEKCPSSGDETESPKKRAKYSQDIVIDDALNNHHNHDSSTTNCNGKVLDHRDAASSTFSHNNHRSYHHTELVNRKTVEIRRLSDCNIKHSASVPGGAMTSSVNYTKPNRRPSTDSLSRYQSMDSYQTMMHKRRKTSATASTSSSSSTMTLIDNIEKGRNHPLHLNHSFEASGGESEHGSRPGTPLFDERPENSIDPRRPPIAGRSAEPMNLPLPKFAQQFHQQLRQSNQLLPAAHATEKHETNNISTAQLHSSLTSRSISPTPQTSQVRSRSNSLMPPVSSGSSNSETVLTSPRPPSLVSNSSDSEQELGSISGLNSSPSLEERLKKFTEDYDSWSSNGRSSSSSHYTNSFRHAVPEIAVPETPELLKNVLKNSMFDEDSKRLENISDKYVTQAPPTLTTATVTSKNAFGTFGVNHLSLSGTSSPMMNMMNSIGAIPSLAAVPSHPTDVLSSTSALSNSLGKLHMPVQQPVTITTMIHQRLGSSGTGSPLNSPNTASPYNSPNPSSASSISSIKGLQYPFPTHPTLNASAVTPATSTVTSTSAPVAITACTSSVVSITTTVTTNCQKPKTSCALGKSVSLQEVTPAAMSSLSSATGNNNNSNNINASCNKSSTNNNNANNSNADPPSKLLMKSASLPNCGMSEVSPMEVYGDEKKVAKVEEVVMVQPEVVVRKEEEKKNHSNHSKDRRKNSEVDEPVTPKEEVKDHQKKEKDVSFRKDKEVKKPEAEKKVEDKKSTKSHKKKDDHHHHHHAVEEKREETVERVPSDEQRKRRVSFEDVSEDSAPEQNHVIENHKKESKHHDSSKSNSKHHHHHNHKDNKSLSREKSHADDENHAKSNVACSKDSIFDELKRNSKDNIIKSNDKMHKSKKHHHHYHRENSTKDKENQTQVNNFNDTSSSIMTEDVGHSSDDEIIRHHNHNHKDDQQRARPESSEESSGKKKYPRRSLNNSLSTDDTDDSDENKKTSFFDIPPDDAPNISMYDKVKARSCKNLKKQEEEKKIKDKFSALKQSRAKRERKRLNTSDDDSDSDMNENSNDMFQMKYRKQLSGSDEDDKDSENELLLKKNRNQFSICDEESSESGITINDGHRKRNKFSTRKLSRTNVIDSSDDEMPTSSEVEGKRVEIKQEINDFQSMATSEFDDLKKQAELHSDGTKNHNNKHSSNGSKKRHHEKNKDERSNKKSKKLSRDLHRKSSSSIDKRDDKMDDIFGPISDDEIKSDVKNNFVAAMVEIKKEPVDESSTKVHDASEIASKEQQREDSRKRKEKRRREREKQRAIKEEDNSVDLDEAGRALEAQLMSDCEHKLNNNELPKDSLKPEDVFRFTDGDDEMKRDGSLKKKKKKKRAKEERKHHHNHHHYDNSIKPEVIDNNLESTGAFNNNNNTKIRMDVVSNNLKPSVPLLTESSPEKVELPVVQAPKKEVKTKPEITIPGFGVKVDETVHQKAVQSIAKELEKKPAKVETPKVEVKVPEPAPVDTKSTKIEAEKVEEKSRVVISQEETEDAVAALLGESFSMAIEEDYNEDPYDVPIVTNDADLGALIPPEEDEEMKNAIMSLNPDMDHKPETPPSEHDLQIDTDNDENVEEEEASSQPFDNPPKTPDVDMAQMEKDKKEPTPEPEVVKPAEVKAEKKIEPIKVAPVKYVPPVVKAEKSPVKKTPPAAPFNRFQPPTITIPQEPVQSTDRVSPRAAKQPSPIAKLTPVVVHETSSPTSPSPTILTPTPKVLLSPITPVSPKIITLPSKPETKTVLTQVKPVLPIQQPTPVVNKAVIAPYQSQQPANKFPPTTPVDKKKIEVKPNNVAKPVVMPIAVPARQPQIIYPPSTSGIIQQPFVKAEVKPAEVKTEQWQQNASSVIQKVDAVKEELKIEKKPAELESSHDEDDFDESSTDNSMDGMKKGRGGRQQRGRKNANVQSPPAAEDPAGIQTRRGGKTPTASKRGRGGRGANAKNVAVSPQNLMPSPAPPAANLMRQQKTSESDVYEFHDDSGEELAKTGDAQRPRLIMTIKSSTVTTAVNTQPIMTSPAQPTTIPTVVQTSPISAPIIQAPPIVTEASMDSLMIPPSPNSQQVSSPAHSDDFAQPNNTRKSRRLQEKDGTRTSVDDTIDDVIRNIAPNQAQQANNRRATRQTATPNAVAPNAVPLVLPQGLVNNLLDPKKPPKSNKKQKDRKVSETSESETEKKLEPAPVTIVTPPLKQNVIQEPPTAVQQQPTPLPVPVQIQKHPEMMLPNKPHPRESSELLQLIDPVTGELQKMTQSKEGQYVPVPENRAQMAKSQIPIPTAVQPAFTVEVKSEEKKVAAPPTIQNVLKVPVLLEPPKAFIAPPAEQTHVIKPVITQNPTYSKPPTLKTYVLSSQSIAKPQVVTAPAPTPPTTVISTQGMMKTNSPVVQHPSTIYNLPNIIPASGGKYVAPQPQKTIVMPAHQNMPTMITHNASQAIYQPQPQIIHQKIPSNGQQPQIVIHSQPHPMMQQQQQGNLMINIPPSSAGGQSISSPRMVKQVIQRPQQGPPPTAGPPTTVVMKAGQPHHIVASNQDPKSQPTYIHQGTKILQGPPEGPPMSYISSGGREIIYVGGNVQKQTIYPNYPPNKYGQHQPIPSPTQPKPQHIVQQIPQQQLPKNVEKTSAQPSVSVTHIQMPHPHQNQQQPKVYFTNSGQVITNLPPNGGQGPESNERHQQWISHEKIQQQPLKTRYVLDNYDEAHRAQQHAAQSQGQVKRSYVIEGPGAHPLPSSSQPILHAPSSVVNQPIIPPQNKTVIGLNQAPQILTGAVASPPLKAHLTSQQPIVTGKLTLRVHSNCAMRLKMF